MAKINLLRPKANPKSKQTHLLKVTCCVTDTIAERMVLDPSRVLAHVQWSVIKNEFEQNAGKRKVVEKDERR